MHGTLYMVWWAKTCVHILIIPHWWNTCEDTPSHTLTHSPLGDFPDVKYNLFFFALILHTVSSAKSPFGCHQIFVSSFSFKFFKSKQKEDLIYKHQKYWNRFSMVGALSAFGLVKGTMDIIGAIFFELMILWFICHRNSVVWPENCKPPKELHPRKVKSKSNKM